MATYQSRQEPLTTCPYNPAHQVKLGRLQIHITKCRKAHQEKDMKQCPFSAEHVVPASQLMHHIYTCPLNTTVERFLTEASGSASLEDKIPKPAVAPVFVSVQAMAPAQRRHYYASLHSKADELLPSDMKPRVLPEAKTLEEEEEELLQMPPMPKTESKVLMHLKAMEAMQRKNGAALYEDSDSGDESDQQFKSKVYRMGLGRGYASAAAVKANTSGATAAGKRDDNS
ncbi:hypothetical protein HPB52_010808 [Rhipicephalus sanguineus]|uniref:CHHC U11-48K-type domain-containing protein n=1 Tax=Rhipicephalus sanguineus TaxID=34632 RepID=A0A9D4Q727_RHISA|nr:hypothetical protein HPB52_010808 [Rhipicephalus sanguineus]